MERLIFEPGNPEDGTLKRTSYESHILSDSKLPFIFHLDTVKCSSCNVNWHENIELLLFIEGSGQVFCDITRTDVRPGDVFVVNSNSVHYVVSVISSEVLICLTSNRLQIRSKSCLNQ
jgi:mannose-6-phosphate isomerase-like protein (cupin superfamily)